MKYMKAPTAKPKKQKESMAAANFVFQKKKDQNDARGSVFNQPGSVRLKGQPEGMKRAVVQCKWTTVGANKVLKKDASGGNAVSDLNTQNYTVIHFDSYKFNRQFYGGFLNLFKQGPPVPMERNGWHNRSKKEIAVSDQRDDEGAASTLVHEVTHANQHHINEQNVKGGLPMAFRDKLAKEVDAHIKQEEFNIKTGIPPKHPSFRDKNGIIDKKAIATYVQRVYAVGAQARKYEDTTPVWKTIETIKPWPKP